MIEITNLRYSKWIHKQPKVFLKKILLKICSKFTAEHSYRSVVSMQSNFTEIALRHGCSPVNLLLIFRTPFFKNTHGRLLLNFPFGTSIGS